MTKATFGILSLLGLLAVAPCASAAWNTSSGTQQSFLRAGSAVRCQTDNMNWCSSSTTATGTVVIPLSTTNGARNFWFENHGNGSAAVGCYGVWHSGDTYAWQPATTFGTTGTAWTYTLVSFTVPANNAAYLICTLPARTTSVTPAIGNIYYNNT